MTLDPQNNPEKKFVPVVLPWLIAAAALVLYLLTLNHWVSFGNLTQVARMSGWSWQPELYGPLFWLLSYPIRWLHVQHIPPALNLFSCVCAVLSLALLARSVVLLPQDRTAEQRRKAGDHATVLSIRHAWLPPLFAALICGLQLTFWEDATAAASQALTNGANEMLDLLVFAYVVRCVLEYRTEWRESWLLRAAFVYGLGITNNWAMMGFFPAFLIALIWIKGLSFFNLRFLTRMFFCGLVALSLYLLLPLVQGAETTIHIPFWPALKVNLMGQKNILGMLFKYGRQTVLLFSLASLVPILVISIRWSSYFGDTSELGVAMATFMFHLVHAFFLLVCVWMALDPPFSPRNRGWGVPFLTFYYLGALSVGYLSAYFLLIFGQKAPGVKRIPPHLNLINKVVVSFIWLLAILAPVALLYRNLPQIRLTNGPMLEQFAALVARGLPDHKVVLLSDDDRRLTLMQSYAARKGSLNDYIFLNTDAFKWADYHRFLGRMYSKRWPGMMLPKEYSGEINPGELVQGLALLMSSNSVYYLHPSFGYYFEFSWPEPHGMVYKLAPYKADTLLAPPLTPALRAENEEFWKAADQMTLDHLDNIITPAPIASPKLLDSAMDALHLPKQHNVTATLLGAYYARALDYWGVELQKANLLTNAAAAFNRALDLNPDNVVAQVNLECNQNLQAGRRSSVQMSKSVEDEFGKYRSWDAVIGANGPFDEPSLCFEQGRVFVRNNLHRQAAQQLERTRQLAPDNLDAHLWLAQLYVLNRMPERALDIIKEIRAHPSLLSASETNRPQLLFVETSAHMGQRDVEGAQKVVEAALKKSPGDEALLATAVQVYMTFQSYSNALGVIEQQLVATPNNLIALNNKGYVCIVMTNFQEAIPPFTRILTIDTNNYSARLNRAISYLRLDNLEPSQSDYELLLKSHPTDSRVLYGLAEIAWRKKDNNSALRYYQLYLSNANTNTAEAKIVLDRVQKLKSSPP